jgi:DNA end-binding protein Ku
MKALWSGLLSFGLINIPVKLYSASEERKMKFRMLDKNALSPISYARISRATNKEVKYEDIVKGYEYQKGDYVILTDEDFQKASPQKTKAIEIQSFVDEHEIESKYFNKPFFIEPDKKAEKAFVLLREALKKAGKVGIARFVLREREHICVVKPEELALMLLELRYQDELRTPEGLNLPESADYSKKEMDIALMLISQLEEHFKPSDYHDVYTEELEKLVAEKAKGHAVHVTEPGALPAADMRNLMEMLRKSLEQAKTHKHEEEKRAPDAEPPEDESPKAHPRRLSRKAHV